MNTKPLVMVVEDSLTQAKQIAATLTGYGFRVTICSSGVDALVAISAEQPALIILDINLPQMDGYQVCSRLKRDDATAHIPVIMLTSADSADATRHGLEVGADDYIPKDMFAMDNLATTIKAYLQPSSSRT